MEKQRKPADAGKPFADLASKLVRVPKREIRAAERRFQNRKKKRKKS